MKRVNLLIIVYVLLTQFVFAQSKWSGVFKKNVYLCKIIKKNEKIKMTKSKKQKKISYLLVQLLACSLIYLFTCSVVSAQTVDSTAVIQDEITLPSDRDNIIVDTNKNKTKVHSPKKAAWMSAALPGLGQIYNKKYWYIKVPIIYGGFVGCAYGININYIYFARYRDEYRNRLKGGERSFKPNLPTANINLEKQRYQRNMETFIIVTAVWYLFNILDAVVYTHLLHFDVSDDLSMNIMPSIELNNNPLTSKSVPTTNITFTFNFK
jgi:hypothetical protein